MSKVFQGIFIIPCTPFEWNAGVLTVDEASFCKLVKYIVKAGAHGIVMPQLASEFYTLSEHERHRITDILVKEVKHRIPVIIGVQATNTQSAVQYAIYANNRGADGVIALPPYLPTGGEERIFNYFQQISDSVEIPIFIQNGGPPMGSSLTPKFIARMVKEIQHVQYVKEEVVPTTYSITADLKACGQAVHGVFGGFGGRYLLEELTRGAVGNMPTCEYTEIVVKIYQHYMRDEREPARELHKELMALQSINRFGLSAVKEVLRRRGIIQTNYTRIPSKPLDQYDSQEIEQNLQRAQKYLLTL